MRAAGAQTLARRSPRLYTRGMFRTLLGAAVVTSLAACGACAEGSLEVSIGS